LSGTTPEGITSEVEASRWVRSMFGRVAHRYDLANHLLSMNIDKLWRARTVAAVRDIARVPDARVLDLCCGTGDLLAALEKDRNAPVLGSDFCHPMLLGAAAKTRRSPLFEADAMQMPLASASLDVITIGFGFRNLANYETGLWELRRILRPGGILAILEFSQPPNRPFAALYNWYSRRLLPIIGGAISGSREAYAYLPESVRKFPSADELAAMMTRAGFERVCSERMTGGIVALHLGS
jgi:demethylmenaquinone methyltransferase / 2-methoxy-6-polyprenyl-1,4-benzoquinol methylase